MQGPERPAQTITCIAAHKEILCGFYNSAPPLPTHTHAHTHMHRQPRQTN